ncbi:hypothetical protein [Bacteroides sp. UBA939]|uniref:hypothetical protein n=1 Tax=Bacteroides sp. UBA939 TaxID=1946092 RepID=UPI0025BB3885|nr:hypothetical protein [Bacteroides sp. UBA939]
MKTKISLVLMALFTCTNMIAQSADIEKYMKGTDVASIDNQLIYHDGKIGVSGSILTQGKSAQQSFISSIMFFAENIPSRNVIKKIDEQGNFFVIVMNIISESNFSKNGGRYNFRIGIMTTDNSIVYKVDEIKYVKQSGLLLSNTKEETFEKIFPNEKSLQTKNTLVKQEFTKGINDLIMKLSNHCINNSYPIINHWAEIKSEKVKIGMTTEECILSWGKPEKVNTTTTSSNVHEQWIYPNDSYLYFEDGILTTIQN